MTSPSIFAAPPPVDYLSSKTDYKLYILVLYIAYWIAPAIIITICYVLIIITFKQSSNNLRLVCDSAQPNEDGASVRFSSPDIVAAAAAKCQLQQAECSSETTGTRMANVGKTPTADSSQGLVQTARRQLRDSLRLNRFGPDTRRRTSSASKIADDCGASQMGPAQESCSKQDLLAICAAAAIVETNKRPWACAEPKLRQTDDQKGDNETGTCGEAPATCQAKPSESGTTASDSQRQAPAAKSCAQTELLSGHCGQLDPLVTGQASCSGAKQAKRLTGAMRSRTFHELRVAAMAASHRLNRAGRRSDAGVGSGASAGANETGSRTPIASTSPFLVTAAPTATTACHIGASGSQHSRTGIQFRLAKMSFYLILLWLVSWTPIASLAVINSVVKCHHRANALAVFTANTMTKLGPTFDVFIYGISHPKIKSKFKQIIKWLLVIGRTTTSSAGRSSVFDKRPFERSGRMSHRSTHLAAG